VTLRFETAPRVAAALLAALHAACFPEDPWDEAAMAGILVLPGCFSRLAVAGDRPVGFVVALDLGGECEILSLGVIPGERRRGIGQAMLADLSGAAVNRGARALLLEAAIDNPAALALYAAAGFVRIGERRGYYRRQAEAPADAVVLRLSLAATSTST